MRNQPGARNLPIALHGPGGDAEDVGDFFLGQPAEEAELDDFRGARVGGFEFRQQVIQPDDVFRSRHHGPAVDRRQAHALRRATALAGGASARVVDENAPHRLRRDREKVDAIAVRNRLAAEKSGAEFVHQCSGFERMIAAFSTKKPQRDGLQLRIDECEQLVAGRFAAPLPVGQPPCNPLGGWRSAHAICRSYRGAMTPDR